MSVGPKLFESLPTPAHELGNAIIENSYVFYFYIVYVVLTPQTDNYTRGRFYGWQRHFSSAGQCLQPHNYPGSVNGIYILRAVFGAGKEARVLTNNLGIYALYQASSIL